MPGRLGRREPESWEHVERYPLRTLAAIPTRVPVVLGINWYADFDRPARADGTLWAPGRSGKFWIGRRAGWHDSGIRGGHALCARSYGVDDPTTWWDFYDQGSEGSCVGFACSRMMSLLNRVRYGARWLYQEAQKVDEWTDTPPEEGTSVKAGCDILRDRGHRVSYRGTLRAEDPAQGISANRWATTWDEVRSALGLPDSVDGAPLLNNWGRYYPHIVWITDEAGATVLDEYGEACLVTDR